MATTKDAATAASDQSTRRSRKLTEVSVERMKAPAAGRTQVADAVVTGLWLRVSAKGGKSWSVVYRPRSASATRRVTVGRWPAVSVKDARDIARGVLLEVAKGNDPAVERKRAERGDTDLVEHVAAEFIKRKVKPRQPRSWQQTATLIEGRLVKAWKGRRIHEITRADVHRVLDREIDAGRDRTANKLLAVAKRLFAWAAERHELDKNPAEGIERPGVERSRDRVLEDAELAAIWNAAGELNWPWRDFARLLILTGQRRSEVSRMRWPDVDLDQGTWHMPAEATKSRRGHTVPLSPAALAILRDAPRLADDDHVFWTGRRGGLTGYTQAKRKLDRLSGVTGWRFHDFRRTAATGMAEELNIAPHVLAAVLNHAPASVQGVTAVYNRAKYQREKSQALDLWARHVLDLAEGRAGKVVALHRPAS